MDNKVLEIKINSLEDLEMAAEGVAELINILTNK